MNKAYLILGTNKGDKQTNLKMAIHLIEEKAGIIAKKSDIFVTAPWGNPNQPEFFNQAICIETDFSAIDLLKALLQIEEKLGRVRTDEKWMERIIDIDILFYNMDIIEQKDLKIPHPHLQDRKFVLIPLSQIAGEYVHPVLQKNITLLLKKCRDTLFVQTIKNIQ